MLLFWNFPLEPSDGRVLEKVADEIQSSTKPFYFGTGSQEDHERRLSEKVLVPLDNTNLFTSMSLLPTSSSSQETSGTISATSRADHTLELVTEEKVSVSHYISFLRTLSNYIRMDEAAQATFFGKVEKILRRECGDSVPTTRKTIVNVAKKKRKFQTQQE